MKTKLFLMLFLSLIFISSKPLLCQTNKLSIGIDYGSGIIQGGSIFLYDYDGNVFDISNPIIPKNIRCRIEILLSRYFIARFSVGYGMTKQGMDYSMNRPSDYSTGPSKYESEAKYSASGFPIEGTIIFSVPVDKKEICSFYFGLGIGYYNYTFKAEGFYEQSGSDFSSYNYRENYVTPDVKLSGFGQFFMTGMNIQFISRLGAFIEVSKLGLSLLKEKSDIFFITVEDHEITHTEIIGEQKIDYKAKNGFKDVGLSIGIRLNLGKIKKSG